MTQKAITIKDLAEKLNISVSTVSRALKDNPEISQQTRKTVQALAKELGYKPNPIAVALKTHKSNTIGVVVPQIVNTFFATVVKKIEDVADKYGYIYVADYDNVYVLSPECEYLFQRNFRKRKEKHRYISGQPL